MFASLAATSCPPALAAPSADAAAERAVDANPAIRCALSRSPNTFEIVASLAAGDRRLDRRAAPAVPTPDDVALDRTELIVSVAPPSSVLRSRS